MKEILRVFLCFLLISVVAIFLIRENSQQGIVRLNFCVNQIAILTAIENYSMDTSEYINSHHCSSVSRYIYDKENSVYKCSVDGGKEEIERRLAEFTNWEKPLRRILFVSALPVFLFLLLFYPHLHLIRQNELIFPVGLSFFSFQMSEIFRAIFYSSAYSLNQVEKILHITMGLVLALAIIIVFQRNKESKVYPRFIIYSGVVFLFGVVYFYNSTGGT